MVAAMKSRSRICQGTTMIRMKHWIGVALCLLLCNQCLSQDSYLDARWRAGDSVSGNWEWTLAVGPMRKQVSMEVQEKQGKFIAVVRLDDGTVLESQDFKQEGDKIQFSVRREEGGMKSTMLHEGILKGDKISGTARMTGGPMNMSTKWNAVRRPDKRNRK
jgi:hypothetical protein